MTGRPKFQTYNICRSNLSALSAVLDMVNYATLCDIVNNMGFIPSKISVRRFVFREIEIRKIFRMDKIRKILVSWRDLLRSNKLEYDYKLFCFNKLLRETNIFRVLPIRKIFRISFYRKTKRLTEILLRMNPILFSILPSVA